jgi:hypothetical protein
MKWLYLFNLMIKLVYEKDQVLIKSSLTIFFVVLGIKHRVLHIPGKHSISKVHPLKQY